jgi:regulator of nonsense transcripts 1
MQLKDGWGELGSDDEGKCRALVGQCGGGILTADVVCWTCIGAGDPRLTKLKFRTVLIDEATQAAKPGLGYLSVHNFLTHRIFFSERMIPLVLRCRQVVLIDNHQQLGPVIMNKKATQVGLTQSLFECLVVLGNCPIQLQVQHRMHPHLSEFPSNMFYKGSLQNSVTVPERLRRNVDFHWVQLLLALRYSIKE